MCYFSFVLPHSFTVLFRLVSGSNIAVTLELFHISCPFWKVTPQRKVKSK